MWVPARASPGSRRTPSVHSVASTHSTNRPLSTPPNQVWRQSRGYDSDRSSDTALEDEDTIPLRPRQTAAQPMWQSQHPPHESMTTHINKKIEKLHKDPVSMSASLPKATYQQLPSVQARPMDDDATSRSSTLDGEEEDDSTYPAKASTSISTFRKHLPGTEPSSPQTSSHVPGPLESQLAALMSKLIHLEQANPTISVTADEYHSTQVRLRKLEEEKKLWWKRHEAIWALRDEDVENNIKIRGMLASCRRELDATKSLRDEDLSNVQLVRGKLAQKTREMERLQAQTGRCSPNRGRPGSYFERRDTSDLFTVAKIAALEQRALELEKRNSDLVAQLEMPKTGTDIDGLNRLTAHQAWKDTVAALESEGRAKDAEITRLRSRSGSTDWPRFEALHEEHASYREAVAGKLQALRSEKEVLQKELHRKENECQVLELKVQNLQRRASMM